MSARTSSAAASTTSARSTPAEPLRVTRGCGSVERRRSPPATVLPSAPRRGWEDRQRASARWQEGMGGSRRAAPPAAGCTITDRIVGSSACAGLPSHPCPPAAMLGAWRLSSQPRCRAARRTVLLLAVRLFLRAFRDGARSAVSPGGSCRRRRAPRSRRSNIRGRPARRRYARRGPAGRGAWAGVDRRGRGAGWAA